MKTLYLDCNMGAAGDMLMAALFEILPDQNGFLNAMNNAGIPGLTLAPERGTSRDIAGTRMRVSFSGTKEEDLVRGGGHGMTPQAVFNLLDVLALPENVRARAKKVYTRIAEAEAKVHGTEVGHIHFHELGSLDALADVTGVCLCAELLCAEKIVCSPIRLGTGQIRCAHGLLPVPAPATAQLLIGVPCYGGEIEGELCTPTGAALLSELADEFGAQPDMIPERLGVGLGKRDFGAPNCLRATLGERAGGQRGEITELVCNLDDMTPETLAYAQKALLESGALDVYIQPGTMKKGRPGHVLTVLCAPEKEEQFARAIFAHTTTIGLRVRRCGKYFLTPAQGIVETEYGTLRFKRAEGWGVSREKPEYSSAAELAKENGVPLGEIYDAWYRTK